MIISDDQVKKLTTGLTAEKARNLSKTRLCRRLISRATILSSGNKTMPFVVEDVLYAGLGRIKGFPEENISYEKEVKAFWEYLVLKIDSCKEENEIYDLLLMLCITIGRVEKLKSPKMKIMQGLL